MKNQKRITFFLALAVVFFTFTGCAASNSQSTDGAASQSTDGAASQSTDGAASQSPDSADVELPDNAASQTTKSDPISVTDMTGRTITLDAPAERIVALTPADCEILYAIGAGNTLVGRGEYCDYPAEILDIDAVQSGSETNIEQIIALEPQVVLMGTMAQSEEQVAVLEAAGIAVVVSDAQDIEGTYTAIELIGTLMGKTEESASIIDGMKKTFEEVKEKAAKDGTKTVYFEVSPLEYGLWTAGGGTFMDELATMLGIKNVFSDVQGWGEISAEQVIERDPDYIVTNAMYFGDGILPVEEILSRDGWQGMKAIKNKAILNADSYEITRPGPRLALAAETLYKFFYEDETIEPTE
ncbi:ABC transporter substrate-binding protein [Lachnospiraceae bacterium ZAX-1]